MQQLGSHELEERHSICDQAETVVLVTWHISTDLQMSSGVVGIPSV